jgi:hypothetical protein
VGGPNTTAAALGGATRPGSFGPKQAGQSHGPPVRSIPPPGMSAELCQPGAVKSELSCGSCGVQPDAARRADGLVQCCSSWNNQDLLRAMITAAALMMCG